MKAKTKRSLRTYINSIDRAVFWPRDIGKLLQQHRADWDGYDATGSEALQYLVDEELLTEARFSSKRYEPITRYIRGVLSSYELAISLRRDSYISHASALVLHGIQPATDRVYVNQEQKPKTSNGEITRKDLKNAFKSRQRQTRFVFTHSGITYYLVSGKYTDRLGVKRMELSTGGAVDCTGLERTLIDIVVRPAYAGGAEQLLSAYKAALNRVDFDLILDLLKRMEYAYPYHQSIGFLLERAGAPDSAWKTFYAMDHNFDFYVGYGMKSPAFDQKWRVYYPSHFDRV